MTISNMRERKLGLSYDAFKRLRVSMPHTLFDATNINLEHPRFDNSGNTTYNYEGSYVKLDSSNNNICIRQSRYYLPYQPGKSLLILMSFAMSDSITSTERVGYFDASDGVLFEKLSGTLYFTIRRNGVDTKVTQTSWNGLQLLTGANIIDPHLSQIFWTDIEWLGVGSVRCGFVIDGEFLICHNFFHANTSTTDGTYMRTATLPCRYEITELGATETSLRSICCTVMSEGGHVIKGRSRSVGNDTSLINLDLANGVDNNIVAIAIRLKSTHIKQIIVPYNISILANIQNGTEARKSLAYKIAVNPTFVDPIWMSVDSISPVEYAILPTMTASGEIHRSGYVQGSSNLGFDATDINMQLGRTINGISDIMAVLIKGSTTNINAGVEISWHEL
jgi:hypothetical protein